MRLLGAGYAVVGGRVCAFWRLGMHILQVVYGLYVGVPA